MIAPRNLPRGLWVFLLWLQVWGLDWNHLGELSETSASPAPTSPDSHTICESRGLACIFSKLPGDSQTLAGRGLCVRRHAAWTQQRRCACTGLYNLQHGHLGVAWAQGSLEVMSALDGTWPILLSLSTHQCHGGNDACLSKRYKIPHQSSWHTVGAHKVLPLSLVCMLGSVAGARNRIMIERRSLFCGIL